MRRGPLGHDWVASDASAVIEHAKRCGLWYGCGDAEVVAVLELRCSVVH
jgi:hypothetical protein